MVSPPARATFAVVLALAASGCGLIGPICRARQHTLPVTSLTGSVGAGAVVVHRAKYGTAGSQNNLKMKWAGHHTVGPAKVRVYLTRVDCEQFDPAQVWASRRDTCGVLGSMGFNNNVAVTMAIITHGRGNPEQLGPTAEYKIWIFGDPDQSVSYTIDITSFYGPDC